MINYLVGLAGMWLFTDGIISIKLYPKQSWLHDHSIRIIRIMISIGLMVAGGLDALRP